MLFEWDETKNVTNQRKHQLSFETASAVFDDPLHVSRADRIDNGEQRWITIGLACGVAVVIVAHTWREADDVEVVRIISARKATKKERRNYENN